MFRHTTIFDAWQEKLHRGKTGRDAVGSYAITKFLDAMIRRLGISGGLARKIYDELLDTAWIRKLPRGGPQKRTPEYVEQAVPDEQLREATAIWFGGMCAGVVK